MRSKLDGSCIGRYVKVMDLMELLNVELENDFRSLFRALLLVINSSVLGPLHS